MATKIVAQNYHHIDNGGVLFSIEDRGDELGYFLVMSSNYYGYPSFMIELPLGNKDSYLDSKWLRETGDMFILASNKINNSSK